MTRRHRSLLSFVLAFALVFAQLATAAHACAMAAAKAPAMAAAAPAPEAVPGHECCPPESPAPADNGNICSQHCQYGDASVDSGASAPNAFVGDLPALRLELPPLDAASVVRRQQRLSPVVAPPPPAILFGVLRI